MSVLKEDDSDESDVNMSDGELNTTGSQMESEGDGDENSEDEESETETVSSAMCTKLNILPNVYCFNRNSVLTSN
jgi:hypothetical protein